LGEFSENDRIAFKFNSSLFKIPHKPPAGSLKVLHALARREGIRRAPKTKINNLETDEFVSNPPFSKKELAGVLSQPTFWRERWILNKTKTWNF
jgi:hypothetical protein